MIAEMLAASRNLDRLTAEMGGTLRRSTHNHGTVTYVKLPAHYARSFSCEWGDRLTSDQHALAWVTSVKDAEHMPTVEDNY